jgi:hypothetical protein
MGVKAAVVDVDSPAEPVEGSTSRTEPVSTSALRRMLPTELGPGTGTASERLGARIEASRVTLSRSHAM